MLALLVIALFLFSCESSKEKAPAADAKVMEPAQLLTQEDVKALAGVDFGECTATERPVVGQKLCPYDTGNSFVQVGLSQVAFMDTKTLASGTTPESLSTTTKAAFAGAERLPGVGDDNFLAPPGLHILKNG